MHAFVLVLSVDMCELLCKNGLTRAMDAASVSHPVPALFGAGHTLCSCDLC